MPATLEIPDRANAVWKEVEIPITTGKGTDKEQSTSFKAELPKTLADAVSRLGEQEVYKRFVNAYVVFLQGKERNKLTREEKPRNRASYLESLGI